ncbi:MAG: hypothetical protein ACL93V_16690 [Candidatus Electrothrix sp. YB6]
MIQKLSFSASTEFLNNFKQVEVLDQRKKFEAVQTNNGHTIFIGIGTDDQLYVIYEQSGKKHGWVQIPVTNNLMGNVKNFAASQNTKDGNIDIAVVMTDPSDNNMLYLSLDHHFDNTDWITPNLNWITITDDRSEPENRNLVISDVHLSQMKSGNETIIVDTVTTNNLIERYWINKRGAPYWNKHNLQFDLSAGTADHSRVGRKSGELVNGIYTMGRVGPALQFVYTPVYNAFNPSIAPNPTNFNFNATKLTATNSDYDTCPALSGEQDATDLFLAGGDTLYYLAAKEQNQMATPVEILTSDLLSDVRDFRVSVNSEKVVIWVLNGHDQLFYLSCPKNGIHDKSNWSIPLPLQSSVSEMSQYISNQGGGITVFANVGNGKVLKGMQDPASSRWVFAQIELPALKHDTKPIKQLSFTTHIRVQDENNNPAPAADVVLKPDACVNVYINNAFYALSGDSLTVKTDATGSVTIVEWVDTMQGTNFNIHTGDPSQAKGLNPLSKPLGKLSQLSTADGLSNAQITAGDGTKSALLNTGVTDDQKKALAGVIKDLNIAHNSMSESKVTVGANAGFTINAVATHKSSSPVDYIETWWGDLVQAVKHFGEYTIELIKDASKEAWHFVVKVAGKVYGFLVDTVEKVAGALESIWNKIVEGWDKFIEWVKFIFEWKDMVHTKDVFKQTVLIFFNKMAEDIQKARVAMDTTIDNGERAIMAWANEDPSSRPSLASLDTPTNQLAKGKKEPKGSNSAPAQFIQSHFKNNVSRSTATLAPPTVGVDPDWSGLTDMSDIVKRAEDDITVLRDHIKSLFVQAATQVNPDMQAIVKKVIADITILAMDLFKGAADKVLDFLTLLIEEIVALLDTPLYIPILSDILKDDFGMELPSLLEILCYVAAIPTTIVYKIVNGKAPFSTNDTLYKNLTKAKSFAELQKLYNTSDDLIKLDESAQAVLFETTYFASGVCTIIYGFLAVIDEETDGGASSALSTPKTILSVLSGGSVGIGSLFDLPIGIKNKEMNTFASVVSKINILQIAAFAVAPKAIAKIKGISGEGPLNQLGKQVNYVSGGVTAILAFIGLVPAAYHIVEIIADGEALTKDGVLGIEDATQNITGKLAKIVGFAALVDAEEVSKQILIAVQGILYAGTGFIQIEESALEAVA